MRGRPIELDGPLPEAYRDTVVEIDLEGGTVIAHRADVPRELAALAPVHVITAHNPWSVRLAPEDNASRNKELEESIPGGVRVWPARGPGREVDRVEESLAVAGLASEEAVALAARFEQHALFEITETAVNVLFTSASARS